MSTKRTPEDIEGLRAISVRLKELGCPTENLDKWIDKVEVKVVAAKKEKASVDTS